MKNIFYITTLVIILSSCSGNKFLNRKYASGRYVEHKKSLKYNTVYSDTITNYTSSDNRIELKKALIILETYSEEKIIAEKIKAILKKDSIFIKVKKGRNEIIIFKNNLPDVTTIINGNNKIIKTIKIIDPSKIKKNKERKIKTFSILALTFSIIPFLGFAFSITAKRLIRKYRKEFPLVNQDKYKVISNLAFGLSIIPALFGLLVIIALVAVLLMLLFGGASLVVF